MTYVLRGAVALTVSVLLSACAGPIASTGPGAGSPAVTEGGPVEVGVIAFNDFHGSLEPPRQSVLAPDGKGGTMQVPAGG